MTITYHKFPQQEDRKFRSSCAFFRSFWQRQPKKEKTTKIEEQLNRIIQSKKHTKWKIETGGYEGVKHESGSLNKEHMRKETKDKDDEKDEKTNMMETLATKNGHQTGSTSACLIRILLIMC